MVAYRDFRAETDPGNTPDFRENCQFGVRVAPGYAYPAVSARYGGYADLASGIDGLVRTSYYFQGQPRTITASHPLPGPVSGFWHRAENIRLSALGDTPCGQSRILNIDAQLSVPPSPLAHGPASYLTMDSVNHGYTIYRFIWTHCP